MIDVMDNRARFIWHAVKARPADRYQKIDRPRRSLFGWLMFLLRRWFES